MADGKELARPQRVTFACVVAGAAATVVLLQAFTGLGDLGSRDQQELVESWLRAWGGQDEVSVGTALGWLGWYYRVSAVVAVVLGVLAVFTARGDARSRTGLFVVGVVAVLGFLVLAGSGVLPAAMLAYALVGLRSADARWWFAAVAARERGETPPPRPGEAPRSDPFSVGRPAPAQPADPWAAAPTEQPRAGDRPFAAGPDHPGAPAGWPPPAAPRRRGRPRSITVAVVVTSVLAGLVGLVGGLNALVYLLAPAAYREALASQDAAAQLREQTQLGAEELARWVFLGTLGMTVLAVCAIAAALWMLLRATPARVVLTVLSALTLGLSLATVVAFPLGLLWTVGTGVVLHQMYRDDANAWFRDER